MSDRRVDTVKIVLKDWSGTMADAFALVAEVIAQGKISKHNVGGDKVESYCFFTSFVRGSVHHRATKTLDVFSVLDPDPEDNWEGVMCVEEVEELPGDVALDMSKMLPWE